MALLFMEGFGNVSAGQLVYGRWTGINYETLNSSYSRFGNGQGIRFLYGDQYIEKRDFPSDTYNTMVLGCAMKIAEGDTPDPRNTYTQYNLYEGSIVHIKVKINNYWKFDIYRGDNTLLGTSTNRILPFIWYYIELKVNIHDTTGSFELRVNGQNFVSDSGIDTRNGGNGYINGFRLAPLDQNVNTYYDDIYIDDSNFHGDVTIRDFVPTGDGSTHNDFTPLSGNRFENVDDAVPGHDADTTYVYSNTLNHKQTFEYTTGALGTVKAVELNNKLQKVGGGLIKTKNLVVSNGSDYLSSVEEAGHPEYGFVSTIWETDPDDSNAWTQSKIENSEFGAQIISVPS